MPRKVPTKRCGHCQRLKPIATDFAQRRRKYCISCESSVVAGAQSRTLIEKGRTLGILRSELERVELYHANAKRDATKRKHAAHRRRLKRKINDLAKRLEVQKARKPVEIVKQQAKVDPMARELAARELCRRRLVHFIQRFNREYMAGWVHALVCSRLEQFMKDVEAQKAPRLMIFMPPRHGKSEIASVNFPAWLLGHHPDWEIIASSYAVSLPLGFSRKVRARVRDPGYRAIFPETQPDRDSMSAESWLTQKGGGYVAAGVGGGITGKGAHVFIIDDPVKDAEEADSETIRDKAWDWYSSTAKTRLSPGGGMLLIQTRWHDDDLSGRLLMQMRDQMKEFDELIEQLIEQKRYESSAVERKRIEDQIINLRAERQEIDAWEVITFPAESEQNEVLSPEHRIMMLEEVTDDLAREELANALLEYDGRPIPTESGWELLRPKGEALHIERFPVYRLRNIKRTSIPRHWSALYQQNPVPDEGVYFRKEMFRYEPLIPDHREMKLFIAVDLAMSKKERADFSVFTVGALDYEDTLHIIDVVRVKKDTNDLVEILLTLVRKYRPQMVGIEKGQYEIAIKPQLRKRMRETRTYFTLAENDYALNPIQDKELRARPLQGRMQQGMIVFPQNQPWMEQVAYELLRFPGGVHDDIVDSLAWLVRLVMKHEPPKRPQPKKLKSWKDRLPAIARGARSPMEA